MKLLSIALVNHDTNFSYYDNGKLYYHKLERTKREKRFVLYPVTSWIEEVKSIWNINLSEIDDIIFQFAPNPMIPVNIRKYIENNDQLVCKLHPIICEYLGVKKAWFIGHHYSHSLSTWMLENNEADISIIIDGLGDGRPWSIFRKDKLIDYGDIRKGSIGWAIRDAGKLLNINCVHQNDIAGKLMGLQAYGNVDNNYEKLLCKYSMEDANKIFSYDTWIEYKQNDLLAKYTSLDWIRTVHNYTGKSIVNFFKKYTNKNEIISYSGGVAQNVLWNSLLKKEFPNLIIPPHSSDEGISLGAIEWIRKYYKLDKIVFNDFPYSQSDIKVNTNISKENIYKVATFLSEGKIVGWYQDNGEIGPRALGNRSILMDPRIKNGKTIINKVKKREMYRPFGASILKEYYDNYFDGYADSYMLYTSYFKDKKNVYESISHIDNSCRVQVVDDKNLLFYTLLTIFNNITKCPMLLNTSLNLAGKPIAGYPQDALQLFYSTDIDVMVIGNNIYIK